MNILERVPYNSVEEQAEPQRMKLSELIENKSNIEIDQSMLDMLKIIVEKYDYLSDIEVMMISPEEEPNTGGYFERVKIDENTYIPRIVLVRNNLEHMTRIRDTRHASAKRVADLLGIDITQLTPELLRKFIIAHEFGHTKDYIQNYERNPDYQGVEASQEWDWNYEQTLMSLPVPGLDPVDLREKVSQFQSLEDFLEVNPNIRKRIDTNTITTLEDLLQYQETAYRNSPCEYYADDFAATFLRENANQLQISELESSQQI